MFYVLCWRTHQFLCNSYGVDSQTKIFFFVQEDEAPMEDACDDGGWDVGDEDLDLPEELAPVSGLHLLQWSFIFMSTLFTYCHLNWLFCVFLAVIIAVDF